MKIDQHLSWGLVLIAVGWVCIAMLVGGCKSSDQAADYVKGEYTVVCPATEKDYVFKSEDCYQYKGSFHFDQGKGSRCFCFESR